MLSALEFCRLALAQVGKPYVLGAETLVSDPNPPRFDCSEFVEWLLGRNRTPIGDLAASQYNKTRKATGATRIGDLVFLRNNPARSNGIGHVAIVVWGRDGVKYVGGGQYEVLGEPVIVEARGHLYGVVKTTLSYWKTRRYYTGLRRFPGFQLAAPSEATYGPELLAAWAEGRTVKPTLAALKAVSVHAEIRWSWLIRALIRWGKGMAVSDAATFKAPAAHAFVVLGAGPELRRRVETVLPALVANPGSKVLVTGGKGTVGVDTEAWRGRKILLAAGIDPSRILLEERAGSTIGNALYSLPILAAAGVKRYTLVTDDSHVRRASADFAAARLRLRLRTKITSFGVLAYPDKDVARHAASAATRQAIAAEVAALLGLSSQFKNTL